MLIVVLSADRGRVERWSHLWGDHVVFPVEPSTPAEGHARLAKHAVAEGWDESVLVHQDDVVVEGVVAGLHHGTVTSYVPYDDYGHVCPKAFTATGEGWGRLAFRWGRSVGSACLRFHPDHTRSGHVSAVPS